MEPYAVIDSSQAPIVYVRVVSEPTDKNYPAYLQALGEQFRKMDQFALIFDTGELSHFPAKYREAQSRWLVETEEEFKGRWLASAFVIKSRLIRGVLMTLYWLNEPYYEYKVVSDVDEAWKWTRSTVDRLTRSTPPRATQQ